MSIRWKGALEDFSQLEQGQLPQQAVQVEEPDDLEEVLRQSLKTNQGILITSLLLIIVRLVIVPAHASYELGMSLFVFFSGTISIYFLLMFVHEWLHAICYPIKSEKQIWIYQFQALLVHCSAPVSKQRFIFMLLLPVTVLGFIPFVAWLFLAPYMSFGVSLIWMIESWLMIFGGIGDLYNLRNIVAQVPKSASVFNYGLHTFWLL